MIKLIVKIRWYCVNFLGNYYLPSLGCPRLSSIKKSQFKNKTSQKIPLGLLSIFCKYWDYLSRILTNEENETNTFVGTPTYCAPEILKQEVYGSPADVWGLGCILIELASLQKPFGSGLALLAICNRVSRAQYQQIPKRFSFKVSYLISIWLFSSIPFFE